MVSEAIIIPSWSNAEHQTSPRVLCELNVWKRSCAPSYVSRNVWIRRMDIFNTTSIYLLPLLPAFMNHTFWSTASLFMSIVWQSGNHLPTAPSCGEKPFHAYSPTLIHMCPSGGKYIHTSSTILRYFMWVFPASFYFYSTLPQRQILYFLLHYVYLTLTLLTGYFLDLV